MKTSLLRKAVLLGTLAVLLFSTVNVSAQPLPAGSPAQAALPTWVLEMDLPIPQAEAEERGGAEAARQMLYDLAAERADGSAASLSVSSPRETAEGWEYTLRLEGQSDFEALRQLLYAQLGSEFDFLGGPIDLSLDLPEGSLRRVDLLLESRPTTGYAWDLTASAQESWALRQPVQNAYRSGSLGAPAVSTLSMKAVGFGGRPLSLRYRRSFEAQNATRRLWIEAAALPETLDLTSPLPAPDFSAPPLTVPAAKPSVETQVGDSIQSLPASFDWRTQGVVTEVRNQGGCGSCWAFGTVGPLESALLMHENLTTDLSEQYLVSCNQNGWNCKDGGWWAHDYHMDTYGANSNPPGAVLESDKTYTATNGTCGQLYNHPYRLYNWNAVDAYVEIPSVEKIKQAIYEYGPISAGVCAEGFNGYTGGVFDTSQTCNTTSGVNHGIVLVGWEDATQSWILRNSWGASWGDSGYMRIRWGVNKVGYGAAYILYEEPPAPGNDDFDSPELIQSFPYTHTQTVDSASTAADDPILAYSMQGYKTLWFRYTPSQDGTLTVDTQGSLYNTMLGVWTGSRGSLTLRAFNDDITSGSNYQSRVELDVTAGIPYQIEVANYSNTGGSLNLNASFVPAGTPCYTLSTSANPALGGSVQADPAPNCGSKYTDGTVVTLSASPTDGYTFTSWGGDASGTETPTTVTMNAARTVSAQFTAEPAAPKDWTFMVFLDGDNNLESYAIADFLEMSAVGSNADLNIVVQMDRISGYDTTHGNWTDTRRFYVTPSMTPLAANGTSLGEVNMGSPEALTDFISWTVTNYPAEHYAVVLWDHGKGWLQASPEVVLKAILDDSTNGDSLQMPELRQVLSAAATQIGHPIDLLGFDACLMAMTEVDNQAIPYASVRVGSEKTEPGNGWPYTPILSAIVSNPAITPAALGTQIAESYYTSYLNSETQAAVDLGAPYTALNTATNNLAQELITAAPDHAGEIMEARLATLEFDWDGYIDLYDFAAQVQAKVTDAAVQNAAQAVQTAVSAAVIHNRAQYAAAHGISVYFPVTEAGYADDYDGSAGILQFTANTVWDEWLHTFYDTPLPAPANDLPANATVFTTLPYTANQVTYGAGVEDSGVANDNVIPISATVWYKFTAYASGNTIVHTSGSDYDTVLALFRMENDSLVKMGENDDVSGSSDPTSRITFQAAAGSTYYFRIGAYGLNGVGGALKFSASGPALECYTLTTSAQPLEGGQVQVSPAPNCPIAGKYLKNTTLTLTAVPAEDYRFGGWNGTFSSVSNPFQVILTSDAAVTAAFGLPPDNDTPAGAVMLATPGGIREARFAQTVDFATADPGDPTYTLQKKPFQGYRTVWYQISPFTSGTLKVNTFGSDYDTVLGVWTRTADQWTRVTWNDNRPNQKKNSSVSLAVNPGTTYYVEIAAKSDIAQNLVVNSKFTPRKASNNLIAYGRLVRDSLTGTDFQRSDDVYAATTSLLDPVFPGIGQGQRSVWYRFTPLRSGTLTVSTEGSQYDTLLGVWYGSRSAPQLVAWDDNSGAEDTSRLSVDLVGRVTYYIEVAAAPGALGSNLNFQLQFAPAAALGENHYEADLGNLTTLGLWEDGGTLLTSSAPRARAGLNFEGRQIRLAYSRLPLGLGKLRVKVDGVTLTTLNQSSPLVQEDGLVWTSKLLKAGAHTLTLESVSGEVNLDWIEVLP